MRAVVLLYFKVVVVKGVLAQAIVSAILWPAVSGLRRLVLPGGGKQPGRLISAAELALASILGFVVATPFFLAADYPDWPGLQMATLGNKLGSLALMSSVVMFALALPRRFLPGGAPLSEVQAAKTGHDDEVGATDRH